jgi:hypothetical protein
MEFFTFNTETELDKLQNQIKQVAPPEFIEGIIIDENHQLSDDAKFGLELAKDKNKWYEYFGIVK